MFPRGLAQPLCGMFVPRAIGARPADRRGPRPGVWSPPVQADCGVLLRWSPWGLCCRARAIPCMRPLYAYHARLPRGHCAAPDDPRREDGALEVPRGTPRQVLVWVGVLAGGSAF